MPCLCKGHAVLLIYAAVLARARAGHVAPSVDMVLKGSMCYIVSFRVLFMCVLDGM